ncbi:MAG: hypothetical protein GWN67_04270, partial [Phycisphaerae bacterium]|nr:hypothetical protein [Gammaproteobacteria bacterium]NIU08083.1 hypothetical protein [Phycisphaerae bacterium]NIU55623.1 hypothetical protein [Phycisphaerae bacterium]NIW09372.1 hypothetical protein [Gammaproteobacteria bacterium]NIW92082.1 hypothetical protein [Phycisphaerae bacterium]
VLENMIQEVEKSMNEAARNLEFEKAAALRDQLYELREYMAEEIIDKPWEKIKYMAGEK